MTRRTPSRGGSSVPLVPARTERRSAVGTSFVPGLATTSFSARFPSIVISVGGGWLRAWERERGLLAEVPTVVLWDDRVSAVQSWGAAAQQMEGKAPPDQRVIRSWWNGEIVDRTVLRGLIEQFWFQVVEPFPWWQRPLLALRVRVVVSPSLLPIHRRWLLSTLREAGLWGVTAVDGLQAVMARAAANVWPVGPYTATLTPENPTSTTPATRPAAARATSGSLFWTAQLIAENMRQQHHIELPPSRFYDQRWWVQHAGFDLSKQKPVIQPVPKTVVHQAHQSAVSAVLQHMEQVFQQLSVEQRTQVAESGWLLMGGGVFPELVSGIQSQLEMPIQAEGQGRYAELVAVA